MVTFAITDVSGVAPMSGELVEEVDDIDDRKHQGFLDAFLEVHPHQGAQTEKVTKVLCI